MRSFPQQPNARHDHARRAVAALHRVRLNKCVLQRMQAAVLRHALNGGDLFSSHGGRTSSARPYRSSIDEHGTSSALALAASILTAGEFQCVTQDPKEHAVRVDLKAIMLLIDDEFHTSILRLKQRKSLLNKN